MKKLLSTHRRMLALVAVLAPLVALFVYVALRSGPLAPVAVTVEPVAGRDLAPAIFGIGTVEARFTARIGPTIAGRVATVAVDVGDRVEAGQLLAEIDPVDLEARIAAQRAALSRAEAAVAAAEAQAREAAARHEFAAVEARRYEQLLEVRSTSEEALAAKRQELAAAEALAAAARANLEAARREVTRLAAEREVSVRQRENLRLVAPGPGLVIARLAEPGSTVVAGASVVEVVDPEQLWIHARFDQVSAGGLEAGLPARIALRSRPRTPLAGRVLRVEPRADAVTEEILAKVVFDELPAPLPPLGELGEVTVALPPHRATAAVPGASLHRFDGRLGVWIVDDGDLRFAPVVIGATDLDGWLEIVSGLAGGERVVVFSERAFGSGSRVEVVDQLPERRR